MSFLKRLKALEEKIKITNKTTYVTFLISDYRNKEEEKKAQDRLVKIFFDKYGHEPDYAIFINSYKKPGFGEEKIINIIIK